jgi:zinc metalloprotease ZmpB
MTFELKPEMSVARDEKGNLRQLSHPTQPFYGTGDANVRAAAADVSPRALADTYVREMLPHLGVDAGFADDLSALAARTVASKDERPQLRFAEEKIGERQATVSYAQTALGLPVWGSGFSVRMRGAPFGVVGSESSIDRELGDVRMPSADAPFMPDAIDAARLRDLLRLDADPTINGRRLLVYRYDPNERGNALAGTDDTSATNGETCPTLSVPPVADTVKPGRYYVVAEILFTYAAKGWPPLNWRTFIEPETGSALQVEALVSCVDGMVLLRDPLTTSGAATQPNAPTATLNALRSRVPLPGIASVPGQPHELRGPFVRVVNINSPNAVPPTVPNGAVFDFSFPSDNFAAVNGYFHCDRCFRLLEELGFNVQTYFDGTTFPVRVDHRVAFDGNPNAVNAQAPGNATSNGSDGFRFALLAPNATVGMAVEQRVTWHEFGHALLWDHVNSPNFRFAHSIGDTLAAILLDPESNATDRGRTFPWTIIARRHDHQPSSGFAWGGTQDDTLPVGNFGSHDRAGYKREQILSSTLFRVYRSLGGAHQDQDQRLIASRRVAWLLLEAIASLSPIAPPRRAADFLQVLSETDLMTLSPVPPTATGILHKLLRWSFEQQGLFQPPGAPTPVASAGAPPEVDAFIEDGRHGGYDARDRDIVTPPGLWSRLQRDDQQEHEQPIQGEPAFVYVVASNRGTTTATGVRARTAVKRAADGDAWPIGWTELEPTPGARTAADVAPGATELLGPFAWTPAQPGEALLFADIDCSDDQSIVRSTLGGEIGAPKIAMLDNNAATRSVSVAPAVG